MSNVLILNGDGSPLSIVPLSIIPWQSAIKLLVLDKVTVIENYDNWVVHSQRTTMPVPAIIMSKKYFAKSNSIRYTKQNLYYRDSGKCQYCGNDVSYHESTIDHYVPKSFGGKRVWDNSLLACAPCNSDRGNDMSIKPLKLPHKPSYYELMHNRKKFPIYLNHPKWNEYLHWDTKLLLDKPKEKSNFAIENYNF